MQVGEASASAHNTPAKADGASRWLFNRDAGVGAAETTADGAHCALMLRGSVSGRNL